MNNKRLILCVCVILVMVVCLVACGKKEEQRPINNNSSISNNTNNNAGNKNNANNNVAPDDSKYAKSNEDGSKTNVSDKIKNAKFTIDGLEIKNIKLSEATSRTELTADVENNTSETKGDLSLKITLLNSKGDTILEMGGYIGTVEAGKTVQLNSSATLDYSEAYDIKIEKN